jgi:hypothetical protein
MRFKTRKVGEFKTVYALFPVYLLDTDEIAWLEYVQRGYTLTGKTKYCSLEYTPKEPTLPKVKK